MKKKHMSKNLKSPLSPGTKENVQFNMKRFGQPSVKPSAKRDYTNSSQCSIVNPFLLVFLARHKRHKSAKPKSDDKPTTYSTKYLCQYSADEDVSSNHTLPMYVGMLAVYIYLGLGPI